MRSGREGALGYDAQSLDIRIAIKSARDEQEGVGCVARALSQRQNFVLVVNGYTRKQYIATRLLR